ncbi:hypothetical protein PCANC_10550 [Puccinia coronata f. sp. avenae]|uniref:Uncharacterized protein n=1 Tax=Puccinia coronata f. sp. avenae TaxID=200324 RepID=A0A2N5VZ97_9BASI|nr:hypothetical protein PCANC_10550 [Puccinia coronata f. sp. avenae]
MALSAKPSGSSAAQPANAWQYHVHVDHAGGHCIQLERGPASKAKQPAQCGAAESLPTVLPAHAYLHPGRVHPLVRCHHPDPNKHIGVATNYKLASILQHGRLAFIGNLWNGFDDTFILGSQAVYVALCIIGL